MFQILEVGEVNHQNYMEFLPTTVLIDAEGKIIATNLRGAALENKLSSMFEK